MSPALTRIAEAATNFVANALRSLRVRLTVATLLLSLLGIWALALYATTVLRKDLQQLLSQQQIAVVASKARAIAHDVTERQSTLLALAQQLGPLMLLGPVAVQVELASKPEFQVLFNRGVFVLDAQGRAMAGEPSVPETMGRSFLDDPDIVRTLGRGLPTVGHPKTGSLSQTPLFSILVPIVDANGQVVGTLGGLTDLLQPNFLDQVSKARYGHAGGFLLIAVQERLVLTASDPRRVLSTLPPAGVSPEMDALLDLSVSSDIWINPLGEEVLSAVSAVGGSGWLLAMYLPTREAFAPIRAIEQRMTGAALLIGLLISATVAWLLRRQLAPLLATVAHLRQRALDGAVYEPLPRVRQDEIGAVIDGFNALVVDLQQRQNDLKATTQALMIASELQERTGEIAQVGGWQVDLQSMKLTWTRETFRISDRASTAEPPLEDGINLFAPEARPVISAAVQAAMELGTPYDLELPIISERGIHKWVRTQGFAVMEAGRAVRLHGTFQDITARKLAEQAVAAALAEKTALLNEVHHRVKNNLQVISSLLRLESGRSTQLDTKAVLVDMQGRIRSMALLHESLYRSGTFATVELGSYLKKLSEQVFRSLSPNGSVVRLSVDMQPVCVSLDKATPAGLLVNELVSNSFKHGFVDGRSGEVFISLRLLEGSVQEGEAVGVADGVKAGKCRMSVGDNGVGLPSDFEARRGQSLGLQLVSDLCTQLGGTLDVGTGPGAQFVVIFPSE